MTTRFLHTGAQIPATFSHFKPWCLNNNIKQFLVGNGLQRALELDANSEIDRQEK